MKVLSTSLFLSLGLFHQSLMAQGKLAEPTVASVQAESAAAADVAEAAIRALVDRTFASGEVERVCACFVALDDHQREFQAALKRLPMDEFKQRSLLCILKYNGFPSNDEQLTKLFRPIIAEELPDLIRDQQWLGKLDLTDESQRSQLAGLLDNKWKVNTLQSPRWSTVGELAQQMRSDSAEWLDAPKSMIIAVNKAFDSQQEPLIRACFRGCRGNLQPFLKRFIELPASDFRNQLIAGLLKESWPSDSDLQPFASPSERKFAIHCVEVIREYLPYEDRARPALKDFHQPDRRIELSARFEKAVAFAKAAATEKSEGMPFLQSAFEDCKVFRNLDADGMAHYLIKTYDSKIVGYPDTEEFNRQILKTLRTQSYLRVTARLTISDSNGTPLFHSSIPFTNELNPPNGRLSKNITFSIRPELEPFAIIHIGTPHDLETRPVPYRLSGKGIPFVLEDIK